MAHRNVSWRAVVFLLFLVACRRPESVGSAAEHYNPDESSVAFELQPLPRENDSERWLCTYASQGKTARFRIELGPANASDTNVASEFNFRFGEGRFVPEAGSEPSVLTADLGRALQAKSLPRPAPKKVVVPFTFVILGENLSQDRNGGFGATFCGWTAMKIFLGEGDDEGQVFLNVDPKMRIGQFSMKEPEYGDLVLAELAKVL